MPNPVKRALARAPHDDQVAISTVQAWVRPDIVKDIDRALALPQSDRTLLSSKLTMGSQALEELAEAMQGPGTDPEVRKRLSKQAAQGARAWARAARAIAAPNVKLSTVEKALDNARSGMELAHETLMTYSDLPVRTAWNDKNYSLYSRKLGRDWERVSFRGSDTIVWKDPYGTSAADPSAEPPLPPLAKGYLPEPEWTGGDAVERSIREGITPEGLGSSLQHLARVPRPTRSYALKSAIRWLSEELHKEGWTTHVERSGQYYNLVAERAGAASDDERGIVVVGAHLDSLRWSPGANDNGSGSAALLEIARAFPNTPTRNDVRLVWFDAEEEGAIGSARYVKAHSHEMQRMVGMISTDMIASPRSRAGYSLADKAPEWIGKLADDAIRDNRMNAGRWKQRHSRSDHRAFDRAGVPSMFVGVDIENISDQDREYHGFNDTVTRTLDWETFDENADLVGLMAWRLANRPLNA